MAGYDSYLELERVLQRLTVLEFKDLDGGPGPVYDMADDFEAILEREDAAALARYLTDRVDAWEDEG